MRLLAPIAGDPAGLSVAAIGGGMTIGRGTRRIESGNERTTILKSLATPAEVAEVSIVKGLHLQTVLKVSAEPKRLIRQPTNRKKAPKRAVSIAQWAHLTGIGEDGLSIAAARRLIASGNSPKIVRVRRKHGRTVDGVQLSDHRKWLRSQPWARYLAAEHSGCE